MRKSNKTITAIASVFFCAALVGGAAGFMPRTAKAEDKLLYEADFENLSLSATADEIYQSTFIAGATRSVVQTAPAYIEAPYTFGEDGYQKDNLYLDTSRGIPSTDTAEVYTFEIVFQTYGFVNDMTLQFTGEDTEAYKSVVIFTPDGTAKAEEYGTEKYLTLSSAELSSDGWWSAEISVSGTGGFIAPAFYMSTTDYESANAQNNTGIRLSQFKVTNSAETVIYELEVTAGLEGNDAIFGATGFAGIASASTKTGAGIEGKTLKGVYGFFDNGWQTEAVYTNENEFNITMESGKKYVVEFEVALFGSATEADCLFEQIGVAGISSQAILYADGTFKAEEYGETKIFESCDISCEGGIFHVKATINGLGGKFKTSVNLNSSAPAEANENKDTGIYFDNLKIWEKSEVQPTGEYRTLFSENFDLVPPETSGSDPMYHATGFAGTCYSLGVEDGAIGGSRSMKAIYQFYEDDEGWQNGNAYLDSGRTSGTVDGDIYRFTMKIKPFGDWKNASICFQYEKAAGITESVALNKDGTVRLEKAAGGKLISAESEYADGVYDLTIYVYGNGGYIFNFFYMQASDPAVSNEKLDTGFYLDDYAFAKQNKGETVGLNKKSSLYNKSTGGDFRTGATLSEIDSVKLDEKQLTEAEYSYSDGILTIKESALKSLSVGIHSLTAEGDGTVAEAEIYVADALTGTAYETDFSGMPDLNGDQAAKEAFFQNSYMDPGDQDIYTADEGDNRMIKFSSPGAVSDTMKSMFQSNPQGARLSMLKKDQWNSISMDWKPENGTTIGVTGRVYDNGADTMIFYMEIDLVNGLRTDDGTQSYSASWNVEEKGNGWYTLTVTFLFSGEEFSRDASGYLIFGAAKEAENTAWYLDNFKAQTELYPSYEGGNEVYDLASGNTPYYLINLCGTFEITSVAAGEIVLNKDADYTLSQTPNGNVRLELTEAFCKQYPLESSIVLTVSTSKGTELTLPFSVTDTSPILPETPIAYDKASGKDVVFAVDLRGMTISRISLQGTDLIGTEYYLDAQNNLVFKYDYLKGLETGEHEFVLETSSGATGTFTVSVSDSTPEFSGTNVYDKNVGGALEVSIELFGKEIVSVTFGDRTLTAEEYAYADGKLTISESVLNALNAGSYTLTVVTTAAASTQVEVKDLPPAITGEYTVKQGEELVLSVELNGKEIVSIVVDGLLLRADEYSYSDGTLTIKPEIFDELAAGERKIVLTTTGGSAEISFILLVPEEGDEGANPVKVGCGSSFSVGTAAGLGAALAVLIKKRRK